MIGSIKEAAARAIHDRDTTAGGEQAQAQGQSRRAVDHAKDAVRGIAGREQRTDRPNVPKRHSEIFGREVMGRGILLWMLGIPIPIIILLFLFHVV
ncbi:MAG: hypothetical protein ACREE9_10605 [Stellaceae bacterium]